MNNLDAVSVMLIRTGAWALAVTFGSASVFMAWASFYYLPAAKDAIIYLVLALGLELLRPKNT
jgi:hypothetical protein